MLSFNRPVFLGTHPDDNCMGCGGLMSRLKGSEFHCYTFTCPRGSRKSEWEAAMDYLQPITRNLYLIEGDALPDNRYFVRRILEEIKAKIDPDIIFTHSLTGVHQSHVALAEEVERIMRNRTILGYAGVKSGPRFVPNLFIELSEKEVEEKIKLLSFFKSELSKYFLQPDLIKAVARVNGGKIGVKYAEAFDVVRIKV